MRRLAVLLFVSIAVIAGARQVAATVTDAATLREIGRDAALILRGVVTSVQVVPTGRAIESVGTVAVERVLKGDAASFVHVRVPGGVAAGRRYVVVGSPTLRAGQQAVFFLDRDRDGAWRPVGLSAGVITVRNDPATGRPVVPPVVAPGWNSAPGPVTRGDIRRRPLSIGEFESLVSLMLASPSSPARERPSVERRHRR